MNFPIDVAGILGVSALSAAYSVSDPSVTTAESWLQLVERFGIMACILLYFIFRDYIKSREDKKREDHRQVYLEKIETYVRDTLVTELQLSRHQIVKNSQMLKRVADATGHCPGFHAEPSDEDSDLVPGIQHLPEGQVENVQKQSTPNRGIAV